MSMILNPCLLASSGFDPLSVAGCVLWMDPEQSGYANNELVDFAQDFSGTLSLSNAGGGYRPTNKTNILNGKSIFRFGSGTFPVEPVLSNTQVVTGPFTVFAVIQPSSTVNMNAVATKTSTAYPCALYCNANKCGVYDGSYSTETTAAISSWYLCTARFGSPSVYSQIRRNNDAAVTATSYPVNPTYNGIRVSGWFTGGDKFRGDIAAVLVYDALLSAGDEQYIRDGLMDLYNL